MYLAILITIQNQILLQLLVFFHADRTQPTLEDLLEYLTGSSSIPPSGFGYGIQPMILFDDDHDGLPIVSACTLSLTFPTNFPTVENRFKEKMDFAIMGSKECYGLI